MIFRPSPVLLLIRRAARSIAMHGVGGAFSRLLLALRRSLRTHGLGGTVTRTLRKRPPQRSKSQLSPHPFDLQHGTETDGYVSGASLSTVSLSGIYSTAYHAIQPSPFRQALTLISDESDGFRYPEQFTFVDLGCGMGRALLIASRLPFQTLVGVELSPDLCRLAIRNAEVFPDAKRRISIRNQDAITVDYPKGPLVIFMYHPFLLPVLRRVLSNLERQLAVRPRPCLVLYACDPEENSVLRSSSLFNMVFDIPLPLSPEELETDPFGSSHLRFTLYKATL